MALTPVQEIRLLVQDNDPALPFVSDDEINYFLARNSSNINRTATEVAKVILLQLSLRSGTEVVDLFSLSSSKAAEAYKNALILFLRNPQLNPVYNSVNGYASGISISDMEINNASADNNNVCTPFTDVKSTAHLEI